ncbi:modulator of macroautophagy TMEM150B [Archocentrus centrarchus]|uniref:modulator of macroautophagy TMEM150B n=1 Tax=Archocentrus centrarchus TaxID=63155 RepID=UPI0011E9E75F|nr:modulator of macroautophagy TMEM150B-like [Archocentrus centrarchus]
MQLWAVLPVCLAVFGTAGIWTVFAVAVTNESVNLIEGILYISQCGTYNLQSCLFSQICNICCFLALWVVVICFQLVRDYGDHRKASISSIVLGFSPPWESVIGNFKQSVLMSIHVVVAILAFFLGLAYFWARLKHILPQGGTIELFRAFYVIRLIPATALEQKQKQCLPIMQWSSSIQAHYQTLEQQPSDARFLCNSESRQPLSSMSQILCSPHRKGQSICKTAESARWRLGEDWE